MTEVIELSEALIARKLTPDAVRAIHRMTLEGKTKKEMSRSTGISADTIKRVRAGRYQSMDAATRAVWQELFGPEEARQGANPPGAGDQGNQGAPLGASQALLHPKSGYFQKPKKLAPASFYLAGADPFAPSNETEKEEPMLLQHQTLTDQAKKHFKLFRSPFANDINIQADVYTSGPMAYVRQALWECAQNHGFMAVVGESGSGKTTLREEFEERIREFGKSIVVIKPFVVGMEVNDIKGKTMKCGQIADAIARTLSPGLTLKSNPDARFEQVRQLLSSSVASGYSHLILIEEAHRLPQATLRHLKGFMELKEGMRRLLGVCLVGQPELDQLLGANQREIREIVQRCERVTLEPLGDELGAYLAHKFERIGADARAVLAPDAYGAIAQRLTFVPRGGKASDAISVCYPLVVNNLVCRAMNAAARVAWPQVDAQVVAGC